MDLLKNYINTKFGIDETRFLEVLQKSPGAEGYILGNLGEELFKEYAESIGYEALRIKEKPEGGNNAKSEDARGDFYLRKKGSLKDEWLVVECKGVKSNSEKRSGLTKQSSCLTMLNKHSIEREKHVASIYKSGSLAYEKAKIEWENKNVGTFPKFGWSKTNPGAGVPDLTGLWESKDEIKNWLDTFNETDFDENAYWDLKAPIRLLQTHMPSTRIDIITKIKSTGPLVSEFNILCVDLFLKTGKHEFAFVNSTELNHQGKSPNHLQQNYTIDILTAKDNFKRHKLLKPWYEDLNLCIEETKPKYRKLDESQLDGR
ncbi:hypothetical protein [Flavobacterium sp.]|uniref:hypothetical protein n=1 Tax=Flavobacterium sp. TaxID=239 RepID=UPI00374DE425